MRVLRVPGFAALLAGEAVTSIGNWVALNRGAASIIDGERS